MSQVFAGIDVFNDFFNCCFIDESMKTLKSGRFNMDREGFEAFNEIIYRYPDSTIALESTGGYHANLLSFLIKKEVCLINPVLIKRFASSVTLRKTKTDQIDVDCTPDRTKYVRVVGRKQISLETDKGTCSEAPQSICC